MNDFSLQWDANALDLALCFILVTLGFLGYHFAEHSKRLHRYLERRGGSAHAQMMLQYVHHYGGGILYGLLPLVLFLVVLERPAAHFGFDMNLSPSAWAWLSLLLVAFLVMTSRTARITESQRVYPYIRKKSWSPALVLHSALGWAVYIGGYEILFRGFLLYAALEATDVWTALIINAMLTVFTHVHKGYKEALLCIPLSFAFCFITLVTGTIMVVVIAHIALSLFNEWFSLHYHPEFEVQWSGERNKERSI